MKAKMKNESGKPAVYAFCFSEIGAEDLNEAEPEYCRLLKDWKPHMSKGRTR